MNRLIDRIVMILCKDSNGCLVLVLHLIGWAQSKTSHLSETRENAGEKSQLVLAYIWLVDLAQKSCIKSESPYQFLAMQLGFFVSLCIIHWNNQLGCSFFFDSELENFFHLQNYMIFSINILNRVYKESKNLDSGIILKQNELWYLFFWRPYLVRALFFSIHEFHQHFVNMEVFMRFDQRIHLMT